MVSDKGLPLIGAKIDHNEGGERTVGAFDGFLIDWIRKAITPLVVTSAIFRGGQPFEDRVLAAITSGNDIGQRAS